MVVLWWYSLYFIARGALSAPSFAGRPPNPARSMLLGPSIEQHDLGVPRTRVLG